MMGKNAIATRLLTVARDLDPKYANKIARIIEGTGKLTQEERQNEGADITMSVEGASMSSVEDATMD